MDHDTAHGPHRSQGDSNRSVAPPDDAESDVTVIGSPSTITPHIFPLGLTTRELSHALRGEMLGHFLLQQYIGGGGMGVVFKALDTTLDRIVAVKVVASQRVDDELQRRFLVEAQSTARLDHPNIARVHYIGRDRGLPYIVFEFIDGENIRDLIADRGALPVVEALSYVYQIAHALAHAWQREVVHRDIKPSNILVTADGQAKLVDMGLARLQQVDETENELTATGITLGTFDYISPEQARDPRLADTRSDIYSLGCTLFYMLAGQAPFAQGTALQKLLQHQSERPPDLRSFRTDVPDSVSRLVRQMLAKAPGDRHQTPIDLIAELAEILDALGAPLPYAASTLPWTLSPRTTPRWRTHALWAVPLLAMAATGLVVDRFSRSGAAAAPFPELRVAPALAAPSPTQFPAQSILDAAAPAAVENQSPSVAAAAPPNAVDGSAGWPPNPLSLDEPWGVNQTLWDMINNWPAPAESSPLPVKATPEDAALIPTPTPLDAAAILAPSTAASAGDPVPPAAEEAPLPTVNAESPAKP